MERSESCDPLLYLGVQAISLKRIKLDISNFVCRLKVKSTSVTHKMATVSVDTMED